MATLTARRVETVKADPDKRQEIPDSTVQGLYLVVQKSGAKSWALRYRYNNKPRKLTIGGYPQFSLLEARDEAREARQLIDKGQDPARVKRDIKSTRSSYVWEEVAADFIELYAKPRTRSWKETERLLESNVTPHWKGADVRSIARRDVLDLVEGIAADAPYSANRTLAAVRRLFNWCLERDLLEASPVAGVKAPAKEESRERILSDGELVEFWNATTKMGHPFGPLFQLLLLSAQRRSEVTSMAWSHLDLEAGTWSKPKELVKNDRAHIVPLTDPVRMILESLPRFEGADLVFPGRVDRSRPVNGFSKAKIACDVAVLKARQVEDPDARSMDSWRLHDLRRTAATIMARHKVAPHIIEQVLNHQAGTLSGVARVYNRFQYEAEKREALEIWAQHVMDLVAGRKADNVAQLA